MQDPQGGREKARSRGRSIIAPRGGMSRLRCSVRCCGRRLTTSQRPRLTEEGRVDGEVIIRIHHPVVVEVAVVVAGFLRQEAGIDLEIVISVHDPVQIRVALPRVLRQDAVDISVLVVELVV